MYITRLKAFFFRGRKGVLSQVKRNHLRHLISNDTPVAGDVAPLKFRKSVLNFACYSTYKKEKEFKSAVLIT